MKTGIKSIFIPCLENNFRPKILETKPLIFYLTFLFLIYFTFINIIPTTQYFAAITKSLLFEITNRDRIELNLNTLTYNEKLEQAAKMKAEDMIKNNYFAHTSPKGITPWYWFEQVGYKYLYAGENLAMGFTDAETVNNAWLNSPGHRANILNKNYKEFGTAIASGKINGVETMVIVQLFGTPQPDSNLKSISKTSVKPNLIPSSSQSNNINKPEPTTIKTTPVLSPTSLSQTAPQIDFNKKAVEQTLTNEAKNILNKELNKISINNTIVKTASNIGFNFWGGINKLLTIIFAAFLAFIFITLLITIFTEFKIQHPDLIIECAALIIIIAIIIVFGIPSAESLKISATSVNIIK